MLRRGSSILLLSLVFGCKSETGAHAEPSGAAQSAEARRSVQVVAVEARSFEDVVESSGTLAAHEHVTLSTKVAGRLVALDVDLASPVVANQVVARVEPTDYQFNVQQSRAALGQARAQLGLESGADVAHLDKESVAVVRQARATLNEARVGSERLATLVREGLAPQSELDAAQASMARAEAGLESAREQVRLWQAQVRQRQSELSITEQRLADTAIRSPITGTVQARRAGVGEYLPVGAPVVEIVEAGPLRLRLALVERDAARVVAGQLVRIVGNEPSSVVEGRVARVAPMLDVETRSLLVEADIENPGALRPGNFVSARVITGTRSAPAVPSTAIVTFAGLQKVLLVEQDRVVERVVTTGQRAGDFVEVSAGLKPGEAVIAAAGSLQQGQGVSVEGQHPAP